MEHFRTKWAVLLISIFLLSSCGGSSSTETTALTPEGTVAGPIAIPLVNQNSATPNPGHVGNTTTGSKSYYRATVTSGTTYTITLYGLSADADLWVYNNLPFDYITGPVCKSQNGGTANEQCVVTAIGSTMDIEVDGEFSLSGATYSISVNYPVFTPVTCTPGSGCFDFVNNPTPAAFPAPFALSQAGSGTPLPWDLDTTTNALGAGNSIHSGGLGNSQTSCFYYSTATSTNSYVSFDLKVNSILYDDLLLFYIDNVLQLPVWSGSTFSQHVMFNTVSGTHTYKWCHTNNGTATGEVWVDNIFIQ